MSRRIKPILVVPIVLLIITGIAVTFLVITAPKPPVTLVVSGTIEAEEFMIAPVYPGRILELKADIGDRVTKEQTLVVLDSEERRLAVNATLTQSNAASAQAQSALVQVRQLERDVARLRSLYASDAIAKADLERAESQLDAARASYQAALSTARASKDSALVTEAGADRYVLTSPITGIIQSRSLRAGEVANAGVPILVVSRANEKEMVVYIPQRHINKLKQGEKALIRPDAMPGDEFPATVTFISPRAEYTPRNIQTKEERASMVFAVRLTVPDTQEMLRAGMTADVEFPEVPYE
jgi:HlyD family secretion protein